MISPWQDLVWFQGSVLAGLALLAVFARWPLDPASHDAGQPAVIVLLLWGVLFDGTHVLGTHARSTLAPDAASRAALPGRWSWGLLLVGPLVALASPPLFPGFLLFAMLWAYWHLVRQHHGLLALYRRRAGAGLRDARLETALLWAGCLYPFLRFSLTGAYARSGLPVLLPEVALAPLRLALDVGAVLLLAAVVARLALGGARHLGPRHLLLAIVVAFHALVFAVLDDLLTITATLTIFHNLQYHRIVWQYEEGKGRLPLGGLVPYLALGVLLGLVWYGPRVIGVTLLAPGLARDVLVGLGWGVAFHHYLVDGRIWRVRRSPELARALDQGGVQQ